MNFVIVIIDTLRYDHIGAHGNDWIETPNLDRLAGQSWVFDNAFSASFATIPHRWDVMTGRYGNPFHQWLPLRHDAMTLPWWLHTQDGYATQLIHDTPHLVNGGHNFDWPFNAWTQIRGAEVDRPWIDDSTEWLPNFAHDPMFDFVEREPQSLNLFPSYVRANRLREKHEDWNCARLFTTAASWVRDNASRDRFLLWVDCFDPHEPWDVPPEFATLYDDDPDWDGRIDPRSFLVRRTEGTPEEAQRRVAALYAAKVTWVDRWLGELLDALEETGQADRTCIVLTADHGTNVGEWGRFGKFSPLQQWESHVPFMIRLPGGTETGRSDVIVQPQDVFPTVCTQAGLLSPRGACSNDIIAQARGEAGPAREIAIAGRAPSEQWRDGEPGLFTVFDGDWSLEVAVSPERSILRRMGSQEDASADNEAVVERLWEKGVDTIHRRHLDGGLWDWLASRGERDFPEDPTYWEGYPGPAGYDRYFKRLWNEW
ncbi:MAG: sulfatase [Armatimonadota bacterium]